MNNLPTLPEIEKLVIGCVVRGYRMDEARAEIEPEYFTRDDYREVWAIVCKLYDSGGKFDVAAVASELLQKRKDALGFVMDLATGAFDQPEIGRHVARLRELALRRRMILQATTLATRAGDLTEDTDGLIEAFGKLGSDIAARESNRGPMSTRDLLQTEGVSSLLGPRSRGAVRLPWPKLDNDLGGLTAGQMLVMMAATSRGKTSWALQVARCAAGQGFAPVIWTMEMSPKSLFRRLVNQASGVNPGLRYLDAADRDRQAEALTEMDEKPVYFDARSRTVPAFVASLRQVRSRAHLGLAIVDYLQLIRGSNARNRAQEVSDNSRALKLAAMDLSIPFVVLSQVDRSSVKGDTAKIGLHSGKESGDIENDADVMLWIEAGELSRDQETAVTLHVGKQREGPAGFSISMAFDPKNQTFVEAV